MILTIHAKTALIISVICLSAFMNTIQAIEVGVKEGDWIEYQVTTTGNPPEQFNVTWAKMEISNVNKNQIITNVTTRGSNGTLSCLTMTLNLEKGQIGAWFIIPANLNPGDSFPDQSRGCNVTVEGEEQLTYAGAKRIITNATTPERIKRWDKSTGVFVQCIDTLDDFGINATAVRTNMWSSQVPEMNQASFAVAAGTFATGIIVIAVAKRKQVLSDVRHPDQK